MHLFLLFLFVFLFFSLFLFPSLSFSLPPLSFPLFPFLGILRVSYRIDRYISLFFICALIDLSGRRHRRRQHLPFSSMTQDNLSLLLAQGQINAIEFYNLFKTRHPQLLNKPAPSKPKNSRSTSSSKSRFQAYQQQQQPTNNTRSNLFYNERIKQIRQKISDYERLKDYHLNENDEIFSLSSDEIDMSCSISSSTSSASSSSCSSVSTKTPSRRPVKPGCEIYQVTPYTSQITFNLKISIMQTEVTDIVNVLKEVVRLFIALSFFFFVVNVRDLYTRVSVCLFRLKPN